METLAHCRTMARLCGADDAPILRSRVLQTRTFAAVRLTMEQPSVHKTDPVPQDDALLASVAFQEGYRRERWMDGRLMPMQGHAGRSASLMDMRRINQARFLTPVDCTQFYFPLHALSALAEMNDLTFEAEVQTELCGMDKDPIFEPLAASLAGAFERPEEASHLFADLVLTASAFHMITAHCGGVTKTAILRGGLAPWQQRRVLELLDANLAGDISVQTLAEACQLSQRHFSRAFSETHGMSPYRWVIHRRIDRAKSLLLDPRATIEEVAQATSFASQSHLTRTFRSIVGQSPAAWRRSNGKGSLRA